MTNYLFAQVDDWCGLYDDTKLISEGHSLALSELARFADGSPFTLQVPEAELTEFGEYVINNGGCPQTTAEAKKLLGQEVGG
jgi:hypothetical protein